MRKQKKTENRPGYRKAQQSKYYHIVKPLIDRYGIHVRKWVDYNPKDTYWADFDQHSALLPIPDCNWSLYICLHEIGHLVKGSRDHSYLQEYHAEKYALGMVEKLGLRGFASMVKNGKRYVLQNTIQDIVLHGLNPNSVRKEVRAWLGITPRRLKRLALKQCTMVLREMVIEHPVNPFTEISNRDKKIIEKRKTELHEIEPND